MSKFEYFRGLLKTYYHKEETLVVEELLSLHCFEPELVLKARQHASILIKTARQGLEKALFADALLYKYKLSSKEGLALMCLAEALLRIPDSRTASELIEDRLADLEWTEHFSFNNPWLINASTFALNLTGKILREKEESSNIRKTLKTLLKKSSKPLIQQAIRQSMAILSHKFVIGETIEQALEKAVNDEKMGYLHSYDMLGEAAITTSDAEAYFESYKTAIHAIGKASTSQREINGPDISIKLSALHPRYQYSQRARVLNELTAKLKTLCLLAKSYSIGLTIDAEEASRLELSLDILEKLLSYKEISDWHGLGFVVQAYQKRAVTLIDWLEELAKTHQTCLKIRLVKGAYWDSEIKLAQEQGVEDYPVFTQKSSTDLSYHVCAQKLLASSFFYPMFATHNAYTIAYIYEMAKGQDFEFQKLYGMGDALYRQVVGKVTDKINCRIYSPVGTHKSLLPYLVRRLLENGANSSFVNHIADSTLPIEDLIQDPYERVNLNSTKRHPQIPLPWDLYGKERRNSKGMNLNDPLQVKEIENALNAPIQGRYKYALSQHKTISMNPFNNTPVGEIDNTSEESMHQAVKIAKEGFIEWEKTSVIDRAQTLLRAADLLEQERLELITLCVQEAGKTISDSVAEVREAVDFCRYYATLALTLLEHPLKLPSPSGEENFLSLHGKGPFVCISPWNFPLAIFLGQISAALVTGNSVLAKPARQTPLVAQRAIEILYQAGVPKSALHLIVGEGATIGSALVNHSDIRGVTFTGSTETAWGINKILAQKQGPIIPFIAETGGQNAMIVDSSALHEQVVNDVLISAFQSAGQRCSSLRVLFLQEEIAPRVLDLLAGSMAELQLGDPCKLSTDIGPVIDAAAQHNLDTHKNSLHQTSKLIYECTLPPECREGSFVTPAAFEIENLALLKKENFGPILHVIRYQKNHLEKVVHAINTTGFGLTQGLHTRIQSKIKELQENLHAGNIYVNRTMIGAMVGSQPFGGEGLSGTGPKAGGPHYLYRFVNERTLSINTTAYGGNTHLLSLKEL